MLSFRCTVPECFLPIEFVQSRLTIKVWTKLSARPIIQPSDYKWISLSTCMNLGHDICRVLWFFGSSSSCSLTSGRNTPASGGQFLTQANVRDDRLPYDFKTSREVMRWILELLQRKITIISSNLIDRLDRVRLHMYSASGKPSVSPGIEALRIKYIIWGAVVSDHLALILLQLSFPKMISFCVSEIGQGFVELLGVQTGQFSRKVS